MRRRDFLKTTATSALASLATEPLSAAQTFAQNVQEKNPRGKEIRDRIKPITKEERLERQEKARKLMELNGMDALFFEGSTSLRYFTGVSWDRSERLFGMVLPKNGAAQYVAPKFEESRALEQIGDARLLTWEEDERPYELVKQILEENNIITGTIGIEETTRYLVTENIGKTMSALTLVSGTPVTAGCRSVKSVHEIELMQIANEITAEAFKAALPTLREGMTEKEFARTISQRFSEFGVNGGALVLFGEASAHPHGLIKEQPLREGDIVLIDGGCSVEGYASDVTRTTVFGKPTAKMQRVWGLVRKAQDTALAAAKPGIPAEAVDAAARKVISDGGYGPDHKYFTHRLGHGIGMEGHEWYYLVKGNRRALEAGNMFSNEPGIYIVGEFGIRLEDEMLITVYDPIRSTTRREHGARLLLPQAESLEKILP